MSDAPIPSMPSMSLPPVRSSTEKTKMQESAAGLARRFSTGPVKPSARAKRGPVDSDLFEDTHANAEAAPMTVTGSMTLGELASVMKTDKPRKIARVDEDGWSAREVLSRPSAKPRPKRTGASLAAAALSKSQRRQG